MDNSVIFVKAWSSEGKEVYCGEVTLGSLEDRLRLIDESLIDGTIRVYDPSRLIDEATQDRIAKITGIFCVVQEIPDGIPCGLGI